MKNLALALGLFLSLNAHATGGFFCELDNGSLKFELSGVTSRSFENALVDANARLTGTAGDDGLIFKADQNFVKADVSQYWNSDDEFRIVLYAETAEKNTTVTIKTSSPDFTEVFDGKISIRQSSPAGTWSIEDHPISCGIE